MSTPIPGHHGPPEGDAYELRLRGHLDQRWAARLGIRDLTHEADGTTTLRAAGADQAALHGVLQRIRDLGVSLISVTTIPTIPINRQAETEETSMTRTTTNPITADSLVRATGPFAVVAGLIYAGIQPIHPPDFVASVTTSAWAIVISLKLVMCLFFIVATAGLYFRQMNRAGWLGLAGFVAFAACWWLQTGYVFAELFILPPLAPVSPEFVDSVLGIVNQHPGPLDIGALGPVYGVLGLLYLAGGILLGVSTVRAGILPKAPSIMLAAAALLTPAAALLPHELQRYAAIPVGLAYVWLGFALWFPGKGASGVADEMRPAAAR
jgi:hypothetical protein